MYLINTSETEVRIKKRLQLVQRLLSDENFYTLKTIREIDIETYDLSTLIKTYRENIYHDIVMKTIHLINKLDKNEKSILYYHLFKGYSLAQLKSGFFLKESKEYIVYSSSYYIYKKAIKNLIFCFQEEIIYQGKE